MQASKELECPGTQALNIAVCQLAEANLWLTAQTHTQIVSKMTIAADGAATLTAQPWCMVCRCNDRLGVSWAEMEEQGFSKVRTSILTARADGMSALGPNSRDN